MKQTLLPSIAALLALASLPAPALAQRLAEALALAGSDGDWLGEVDQALSSMSWDITQRRMAGLIAEVVEARQEAMAKTEAVA